MAWYKCGGGGALSETVLWTNPSPTSNQAASTVSLTDNISNYKYIKIYWKNVSNGTWETSALVDVEEFTKWTSTYYAIGICASRTSTGTVYYRTVSYNNDNSVKISAASESRPERSIITQISGLK